jgi:hypothetical protein
MLVGKAGAYPSAFKCFSLGRLLALPTNNRIGWKGLQGENTLAYYENS